MKGYKFATAAIIALALGACANTGGAKSASSTKLNPSASFDKNPYPSTYKPYPGQPVLIHSATILDGAGGRIEHGGVILKDGKVLKVLAADEQFPIPDGAVVIDGTG